MADRTLVLAIFDDQAAADDAMGVPAVDATGKLKGGEG